MPVSTHLLERAYQLINANQLQNAELVLDAVVRVDPQNVDGWRTYLRIHQSQNDLDWLKERILKTRELSEADKTGLVNYYKHLTQQLNDTREITLRADTFALLLQEEKEETTATKETMIQFELIDVFDYPIKIVKKETRTGPRRRTKYNAFVLDIAIAALKTLSRDPFGRKITAYIQRTVALANELVKSPKDVYARFSKWIYFEKSVGITLLTLFFLGVRLIASSHFLGYGFLGVFVIGSGWWLISFGSPGKNQTRVYLHENTINLPEIIEAEIDQEQKYDKAKLEKSVK